MLVYLPLLYLLLVTPILLYYIINSNRRYTSSTHCPRNNVNLLLLYYFINRNMRYLIIHTVQKIN